MRHVKLVMIGRHMLAWLWLLLWLTASPGVQARMVNSGEGAPAITSTDGQGDPHSDDLAGLRFQALRASRRFDFQSTATDSPDGLSFFDAGISRRPDSGSSRCSCDALPALARGWQFLLRAALSPRAPSFVS